MRRLLAVAAAILLVSASVAHADPVLDRVTSAVVKGRRLDIEVESTFTAPGELAVTGTVNGVPVSLRKAARAGRRTVTLKVDAKKLGLRKLAVGLRFDLDVTARETGGAETSQDVDAYVPLPCIYLPGFGNETTPGASAVFTTALNLAAGGIYTTGPAKPTLIAHEFPSTTASLATLGKGVARSVKSALKGTVFAKVDVVGYSYGGVVARSFLAQGGGPRVRRCVFVASPNLGIPLAYAAVGLTQSGALDQFLVDNPALADLAAQLLSDDARQALRNVYPTYGWVTPDNFITRTLVEAFLGDDSTPLTALNATAPPPDVAFDAFFYTSTGIAEFGTVDKVDVSALTDIQNIDPASIATGSGDGVVPAHSVTMDEVAAWHGVITPHDLGAGTHVTILADLNLLAGVAAILTQ